MRFVKAQATAVQENAQLVLYAAFENVYQKVKFVQSNYQQRRPNVGVEK
jgi:hypothetical protein